MINTTLHSQVSEASDVLKEFMVLIKSLSLNTSEIEIVAETLTAVQVHKLSNLVGKNLDEDQIF